MTSLPTRWPFPTELIKGQLEDQREARRGWTRKPSDHQSRKRGIKAQTHGHATAKRKGVQVWGLTAIGVSQKASVVARNSRYQALPPLTLNDIPDAPF